MNRLFLASLSLPLVACYGGERASSGKCPAGEVCSDSTPRGLEFVGNHLINDLLLSGPRATAIGGTQTVALQYDRGDGVEVALDLPYTADDDGGLGVKVQSSSGSQVIMLGAGSRTNYLRILDADGLLMDRKELTGASIAKMELVATDYETIPEGTPIAFATGEREIGVALWGDVQNGSVPVSERLVDTSMQLTLPGSTRVAFDTLKMNVGVAVYPLGVIAGDKPMTTLAVVGVDHADSVTLIEGQPSTIMPNTTQNVCFEALAAARHVIGLAWTFNVDGTQYTQGAQAANRNCISIVTPKTTGTVAVMASAGGQSASTSLTVAAAREQLDGPALSTHTQRLVPDAIPTSGDRAQM